MAFPASTKVWLETMDPYDIVDFEIDLAPLLATGETVDSFDINPLTEAELYGLTVKSGSGYTAHLTGNILKLWLSIDPAFQSNKVFVHGITLPLEITIQTDSIPMRRKQRTVGVRVIQR